MKYRFETTSVEGFVQILAANYLPHGYWFYVTGRIPPGKDASVIDAKIITKYGIDLSRQQRARRKQMGQANLHYIRYRDFFVILATHGQHRFFADEAATVRDIRKSPIQFDNYSISVKRGQFRKREGDDEAAAIDGRYRVRVQIARTVFRELWASLLDRAIHLGLDSLGQELFRLPIEPYAPVRKQLLKLVCGMNTRRTKRGFTPISFDVLRLRRRIVEPFGEKSFQKLQGIGPRRVKSPNP